MTHSPSALAVRRSMICRDSISLSLHRQRSRFDLPQSQRIFDLLGLVDKKHFGQNHMPLQIDRHHYKSILVCIHHHIRWGALCHQVFRLVGGDNVTARPRDGNDNHHQCQSCQQPILSHGKEQQECRKQNIYKEKEKNFPKRLLELIIQLQPE